MSDEDDGYQDDFYDQSQKLDSTTRFEEDDDDDDDEQHQQKVNGKMEILQQKIEELESQLSKSKFENKELRNNFESELSRLKKNSSESKESGSNTKELQLELQKYKKKCETLEEKIEISLLTSSSSSKNVPLALEQEFHAFCRKSNIYPDWEDKLLTIDDCIEILETSIKPKSSAKKSKSREFRDEISLASPSGNSTLTPVEIQQMQVNNRLNRRIRQLEEELKQTSGAAGDIEHLKTRIFNLSEKIRNDKDTKRTYEIEVISQKKKIEMLSEHIEKLVLHIKREGALKVRLAEQLRALEKEHSKLKEKSDLIARKSSAKDRLILELREGSKVLEDQLRLMDEKFLELRSKLDWARTMATKKIKRAEKTASDLRVKFAMSGAMVPLDSLQIPSSSQSPQGYPTAYGTQGYSTYNDNESMDSSAPSSKGLNRVVSKSARNLSSRNMNTNDSIASSATNQSDLTLEGVIHKIRLQQGARQDWTEEKARLLAKSH